MSARRGAAGKPARPSRPPGRLGAALDGLRQQKGQRIVVQIGIITAIVALQWLQLQFSTLPLAEVFLLGPAMIAVNLVIVLMPSLLLAVLLGRWWMAFAITSPVIFLWAVINYFVIRWHGSPVTVTLFRSAATALEVLGSYVTALSAKMLVKVLVLGGMLLLCIVGLLLLRWLEPAPSSARRPRAIVCRILFVFAVGAGLWAALLGLPARAMWEWQAPVWQYGYLPYFLMDWKNSLIAYSKPEGYDAEELKELSSQALAVEQLPETLPDIFLILNETFYDLKLYTELETDQPYLERFYSQQNALRGYAVVPNVGGCTNDTEYELLTSNSTHLLTGTAPFTYLNMTRYNSFVRYVENMGYTATALHCAPGKNYNRNLVYPELGFEQSIFEKDFQNMEYFGSYASDTCSYQNMLRFYQPDSDQPQMLYLLTIQNHGDYCNDDPSLHTVHPRQDFGELAPGVSEYLTRISVSDAAFAELIAYFEQVDRPVIVCMLGDHAPSFISSMPARPELSEEERSMYSRATPFVIWANFPIESGDAGFVNVTDLVPMLLQTAGLPLSPYYQSILQLHAEYPVRINNGLWRNAQGEWGSYATDGTGCPEPLRRYFMMEYNNLEEKERIQVLFEPPVS